MTFLNNLWSLLPVSLKSRFIFVQFLSILSSFSEVLTLALFVPLIQILTGISEISIWGHHFLLKNTMYFGVEPIVALSIIIFIVVLLNACIQMLTVGLQTKLSASIGIHFSHSLYNYLLKKDSLIRAKESSSVHINKVVGETNRLSDLVIFPILQLITKFVLVFVISAALLKTDFIIFFSVLSIIGGFYVIIYLLFKNLLIENGVTVSREGQKRIKILQETIGASKEIEITNAYSYFSSMFNTSSVAYFKVQRINQLISLIPRYIIEILFFITFLLLIFIVRYQGGEFISYLPKLAFFGMSSIKLLPQLQAIFLNLSLIKSNLPAYYNIYDDLKIATSLSLNNDRLGNNSLQEFESLYVKDVAFSYGSERFVFDKINLTILPKTINAIIGSSGGGKSTLLNLLMGIYSPIKGELLFNNIKIKKINSNILHRKIGYVPQKVFLLEASIAENVAFGIELEKIDRKRVEECLVMAELIGFVSSLPMGIDTLVGEGGSTLSGGQVQRLGIARALYRDPEIIFLDEATSSLDADTQVQIMKTIFNLKKSKTVVFVTHDKKYLDGFDNIFLVQDGNLHKVENRK